MTDTNILPRDQNHITAVGFESSTTPGLVISGKIDETTGRILTDNASTGSVTSVSVVTANGISGTVANPTTTPAITLTLGAITPTTVNGHTFTAGSSTFTGTAGQTYTFPSTTSTLMANPMTTGGDIIYGGTSGAPTRLANGTAGYVLQSNGTTLAPSWAPAGAGDVIKVGTPVNNQVGVWTGDGTIEGDAALTFDTTTDTLTSGILNATSLTASELTATDVSKNIVSLAVATYPSLAEIAYVKGVTSSIQTQLGAKASTALDNLASVAINTTIASDTDNTDDLGTTVKKWANLFVTTIGATATRITKGWFTDIESTNMPTVGGTAILTSLTAPQFTTIELGHASDTTLSRVSAGVIAVEGVNVLTTATGLPLSGGTMTGDVTLGENASIALDPAGSADGKYTGITIAGTAGATLAFGDVIVLDVTASKWLLADANSAASADGDARGLIGMCVLAANDTQATKILLNGVIRADAKFPTLTITAPVYLSETAGAIVVAQPTTTDVVIRTLGFALTADEIYFNPSSDYITHI